MPINILIVVLKSKIDRFVDNDVCHWLLYRMFCCCRRRAAVGLHAARGCTMYIQYNRGIFIYYHNKQIVSILDYYTNNSSMMM